MKKLISVIGSDVSDNNLSNHALKVAEQLGRLIGEKNLILVCGGRGGIMKAVCKGVKDKNGTTVGILPNNKEEANKYVDIPIISGMGNRRNAIISYTSDVIIAIAGRWGTLNEISFSMIFNKPVILIKGTGGIVDKLCKEELNEMNYKNKLYIVKSPEKAIEKVFELI